MKTPETPANSEDHKETLTLNERLTVMLKEYDAGRKEVEQLLSAMPDIGKSTALLIAGALVGLKSGTLGSAVALCVPPIVMTALGAIVHTQAKLERVSIWLMTTEERVYQAAKSPLITHETLKSMKRRHRGGGRWYAVAVIGVSLYLSSIAFLYAAFPKPFPNPTWIVPYWTFVAAAGVYPLWSAFRIASQRSEIPEKTPLTEHLENLSPSSLAVPSHESFASVSSVVRLAVTNLIRVFRVHSRLK